MTMKHIEVTSHLSQIEFRGAATRVLWCEGLNPDNSAKSSSSSAKHVLYSLTI